MMEPITTTLFGWGISKVADTVWQGASDRVQKTLNQTDVERAIKSGLKAVQDWEKHQNPPDLLFYSVSPDGRKSVPHFLEKVFNHAGVQQQLQRPLNDEGQPQVEYLVAAFQEVAKQQNIQLNSKSLTAWIERFVNTYFQATATYLTFQVIKKSYFKQLANFFDDIKFAGIDVPGEEIEKSERLAKIFVMPDVVEQVSSRSYFEQESLFAANLQDQSISNSRARSLLENRSGRKLLAAQLLQQIQSKKFVLLGAPGSGKTTLLSYFAVMLARETATSDVQHETTNTLGLDVNIDWLPILIRMRDFARHSEMSLLEYAKKFTAETLCLQQLPQGFFEYWLKDGRALILLDGLDEVAEEAKRCKVVEKIDSFLHQYDQNIAIITFRPAGYRRDFFRTDEFSHYELEAFDDDKIEAFIDNWYDSRVPDKAESEGRKNSLIKALSDNDRIKLLARHPLLLTIIALIHRYQAVLPKERYKLYEKAVETLLICWDSNKELTNNTILQYLQLDDLRRLMEQLAYWVHTQGNAAKMDGGTLIYQDELLEQLSQEIKTMKQIQLYQAREEAERFIDLIRDRTGLLNEQGQDYYGFVHKTFQEYLCAQEIDYQADNEGDFDMILGHIRDHLHDPHWREVLLLLIAQQKPKKAAKAIRAILNKKSEYEQWLHRDLLFAGYCLAENIKGLKGTDSSLGEEILERLVELEVKGRKQVGTKVRKQVFKILCSFYETDFETQVLQLLKAQSEQIDEYRLLKYRAALGEQEAVINTLIQQLTDEKYFVREKAAFVLGKLGKDPQVVIYSLLKCLIDEKSSMRRFAASALGKLGNASQVVIYSLLKCLSDQDVHVRGTAAEALGELGNASRVVIDSLLKCLSDEDAYVRGTAAKALGKLGKDPQVVIYSLLLKCLSDEDAFVRGNAAIALGQLGNASQIVIDSLLKCLSDDKSFVRGTAAIALGQLGNASQEVIDSLLKCLSDEDVNMHGTAASALGKLGNASQEVIYSLLECLSDEDSYVGGFASSALLELDNASQVVIYSLLKCLSDEDVNMRGTAASALGELGNASRVVIDSLLKCLSDEDAYVRGTAATALIKLGQKSDTIISNIIQSLEQHRDAKYIGYEIDTLWGLVVEE